SASGRYGNKRPAGERSTTKRLSGTAATLQAGFRAPVASARARSGGTRNLVQSRPLAPPRPVYSRRLQPTDQAFANDRMRWRLCKLPCWPIDLRDRAGLLQGFDALCAAQQLGRLAAFERATGGDSHSDRRHTLVIRHISDDDQIVFAEAVPTADEPAP